MLSTFALFTPFLLTSATVSDSQELLTECGEREVC